MHPTLDIPVISIQQGIHPRGVRPRSKPVDRVSGRPFVVPHSSTTPLHIQDCRIALCQTRLEGRVLLVSRL